MTCSIDVKQLPSNDQRRVKSELAIVKAHMAIIPTLCDSDCAELCEYAYSRTPETRDQWYLIRAFSVLGMVER